MTDQELLDFAESEMDRIDLIARDIIALAAGKKWRLADIADALELAKSMIDGQINEVAEITPVEAIPDHDLRKITIIQPSEE